MTTPFKALQPHEPRVVEIPYVATFPLCVDVTDLSDVSDSSDFSDGGGEDVVI